MAERILDMRQRRAAFIDTMQSIIQKSNKEGRALTEAEQKDFDGLMNKETELRHTIERAEALEGLVRGDGEQRTAARGADSPRMLERGEIRSLSANEKLADIIPTDRAKNLSLGKYLRGIVTGRWDGAEEERSVMSEGTLGQGGYLVPAAFSATWIDLARAQTVTRAAGTQLIPMEHATLRLPRQTNDPTVSWKAENAAMTASALTFDAITFTARTLVATLGMSVELFEDSAPAAAEIVTNALTKKFAVEMDRVALVGSGSGQEPTGIVNVSGINTLSNGTNGAVISNYDQLNSALSNTAQANGDPAKCSIIMSPRSFYEFGSLKNSYNDYLKLPNTLQGVPMLQTSQISNALTVGTNSDCSQIIVGDFSQTALGVRTGINIEATRYGNDGTNNAFSELKVLIRAYMRVDFQVFRPSWFTLISGVR